MKRRNKIRAGIIGCGNIAGFNELDAAREKPCTHVGAYRSRKDVEVVGCCDRDIHRAKKFAEQFNITFYTDSIRGLLAERLDIVSICVPYQFHYETLQKVAASQHKPKIIFLEKPIADDFLKARAMVSVCARNKIKLYVNNRRLSPFYETFREVIATQFNNEVISLTGWCSSGMHAIGIHMVDLLRSIAGEVNDVFATQEKERVEKLPYSHNFHARDPRFNALIRLKNGMQAVFLNSARTDFTFFEMEAICKTGRVRARDNGGKIIYQEKSKPGVSTLSYRLMDEKTVDFKSAPLFKQLINEILDGDHQNSLINGDEALKSYAVIEAMKKSAKMGKAVKVAI